MNEQEIIYQKGYIHDETPNKKETLWGVLIGLGYLSFFVYVPFFIILFILGYPHTQIEEETISVLAQVSTAFICIGLMYFVARKPFSNVFKNISFKVVLKGFLFMFLVLFVNGFVSYLDQVLFGPVTTNANQSSIEGLLIHSPVLGLLMTVIAAPLIEELIFRFFIFKPISKKSVWLAFIVSALGFGLIHMGSSIANFLATHDKATLINDLRSLPSYVAAGATFCFIYYKTKTIWTSIFAHAFQNLVASIIILSGINGGTNITKIDVNSDTISIYLMYGDEVTITNIYCIKHGDELETKYYGHIDNSVELDEGNYLYVINNLDSTTTYNIYVEYEEKVLDIVTEEVTINTGVIESYATTY